MPIPDTQTTISPTPPRKRWWWALAFMALLTIFLLLFAVWIFNTNIGLRTSISLAERFMGGALTIEGVEGAMTGPFKASKLHFESATLRIDATDISVDGQSHSVGLVHSAFSRQIQIDSLSVNTITVATKPSTTSAKIPTDLTLPFSFKMGALSIDRLRVVAWEAAEGLAPVTLAEVNDIHARAVSDGRFHQLSDVALTTVLGRAAAGIVLDGAPPFNLAAAVKLNGSRDDKRYQISADATGTLVAIAVQAKATGWNLNGDAEINVTPFAPVPIQRALINMGEINPAAFSAAAPHAALTIRANLTTQFDAKKSAAIAVGDWNLIGPIEITNRSPAALDQGGIPVTSLRADAEWKNAALDLRNLSLVSDAKSGSSLTGTASLRQRVISAQLSVKNVDPQAWVSTLKTTRINGVIALAASETAQSIEAKLQEPDNKIAPWRAELIAAHQGDEVEIKALKLLAGNAALNARGKLSLSKNRVFSFTGGLADFDPARFANLPHAKLNADFNASGELKSGELKPELSADIKFDLRNSMIVAKDGTHALTGRGDIQFSPSRIARAEVMLDLAGNRLDTSGAWGRAGDKLKFTLTAPRLDMLGLDVSGKLDAGGELTGTLSAPSGEINASATSLKLTSGSGTKIDQVKLNAKLSDGLNGTLEGALKIIGIKGDASPDKTFAAATLAEQIDANLSGTRAAHSLRVLAKISDTESAEVGLNGALAPDLKWQGKLDRLTINSRVVNLVLANAAPLSLSREAFKLGLTELRSSEANPTGKARIRLVDTEWTPLGWQARGDMAGLQLNTLRNNGGDNLGRKLSPANAAKLTLGAEWDLRASEHLNGSVRVFRESGDVLLPGDAHIASGITDLEIKLNAVQDKVSGTVLAKGEKFGVLTGAGTFEVQRAINTGSANYRWQIARSKPITLEANADMASVSWLGPLIDPALQLTGKLRADMKVTGTAAAPLAIGSLRGSTLTAAWPDEGFKLSDGKVAIDFSDTRATLSQFSFRADPNVRPREGRIDFAELKSTPGTLTGSGELALADGKGAFKFKADKLALIQRANRWLMLSGDATVNTAWDAVGVVGKLRADAGYFELASAAPPRLSDDVLVRGAAGGGGRMMPTEKAVRFSVDIDADLGNQLYFNGRGLSTRLAGGVRLRAEPKSPLRVLGSVSAAGGTFDAYGQYLTIERGIVNFQGPIETAGLNVLALRKGLAVEAGVEITGTVTEPRVRLVSEPNVPDTEKLSWIVVGRGQDQAGSSDSALLLSAATAILGGSSDSLPRQIAQGLGFDQLTVSSGSLGGNQSSLPTTTAGGSTTASTGGASGSASGGASGGASSGNISSQIVTLGKRLSANAYVSYEQSLAGASSVVKLTYNLSRRISIIGRAGTDNSIDLSYSFSFN